MVLSPALTQITISDCIRSDDSNRESVVMHEGSSSVENNDKKEKIREMKIGIKVKQWSSLCSTGVSISAVSFIVDFLDPEIALEFVTCTGGPYYRESSALL